MKRICNGSPCKGECRLFYSGSDRKIARQSVFGKSDGHRSSYDFSQELPRKIWEEKVLVYLEKKMRHISKSEIN